MYKKLFLYISFSIYVIFSNCAGAQQVTTDTMAQPKVDTTEITLLFAGDVMGHMPQINSAYDSSNGIYNFNPVFSEVKPFVSQADIAIANLETTLAGKPYSGYPQFSAPDSLATALKSAGFDILINANNHCLDRGKEGLERTIAMLDSFGIPNTGTFIDENARNLRYPLIYDAKGFRLAFLNCTYGTNGIPVQKPNVVNFIDTIQLKQDLAKAKQSNVDYTIVTIHWGTEYERTENAGQRKIAAFLLRNGADMVIGSHPHVVQPVVKYYTSADSSNYNVVVYSLGNYVSNQRDRYKDGGIMFNATLQKTDKIRLKECSYTPVWVFKGNIDNKLQYKILPVTTDLLEYNFLDSASRAKADEFRKDTETLLQGIPVSQPFVTEIIK
jgi:poly-gamma-glutamate synthesis protein (capsule biosynthesis protein)